MSAHYKLVPSHTKNAAYKILRECVRLRAKRKDGEAISPGEEYLLRIITHPEVDSRMSKYLLEGLICLAASLEIFPVPDWWRVKIRMFPYEPISYYLHIDALAARNLLTVSREFTRSDGRVVKKKVKVKKVPKRLDKFEVSQ